MLDLRWREGFGHFQVANGTLGHPGLQKAAYRRLRHLAHPGEDELLVFYARQEREAARVYAARGGGAAGVGADGVAGRVK